MSVGISKTLYVTNGEKPRTFYGTGRHRAHAAKRLGTHLPTLISVSPIAHLTTLSSGFIARFIARRSAVRVTQSLNDLLPNRIIGRFLSLFRDPSRKHILSAIKIVLFIFGRKLFPSAGPTAAGPRHYTKARARGSFTTLAMVDRTVIQY